MTETLTTWDYISVTAYFVLVLGVGIWVGASIFASSIGAPMFIGLAGASASSGYSVIIYEWHAVYLLIALGWFFVPVYISSGSFTVPEYLKKRFGGRRLQICLSILALLLYILTKISVEIYCGALFMQLLLGWNIYICIIGILVVTAIYTVIGGLVAVMYTDTLQTVILLIGACVLTVKGFMVVGGMQGLEDGFMDAVSNTTLVNTAYHGCGLPPNDSMHIWRDAVTGDIPWPGAVFGLSIIGLWVWCTDQLMVQRSLSAKNMSHAKGGSLLAAALKLFSFFLFIAPGMISRILYPDEIACSSPDDCYAVCRNKAGCSNIAYPLLVLRVLPEGLRGLMLAALLAALMSSLTSIFNSASSMFTMDVWPYIRKNPSNNELMVVGRVAVIICTGIGIIWLPVMQQAQGGQLWGYLQAITAYIAPPWTILFLFALLWKRTTEKGAFWGLLAGLLIGFVRLCLEFVYSAPLCGSGEEDTRPAVLKDVHFLYFAMILSFLTAVIMIVVSLVTTPRPNEKIRRSTWWTRHEEDPETPDSEMEDDDDNEEREDQVGVTLVLEADSRVSLGSEHTGRGVLIKIVRWLCGTTKVENQTMSKKGRAAVYQKFTSLEENPVAKSVLNITALGLALLTCFFLGYLS